MTRTRVILATLLLALAVVGTASADSRTYVAHLTGDQEVPGNDSLAQGQAVFRLNWDGTELHYRLLTGAIDNVTQAHIHVGPRGANGPVVLWLYPPAPPSQLIPGQSSGVLGEGTATAADLRGPLAGQPLSALIAALESGGAYVNVHTSQFPGGEIRGQVE